MPVTIPTITTIRDQIISDINARLGASTPIVPKAAWRVLATALAGALSLLYRYGAWVVRQIFASTADDPTIQGAQYGIVRTPAVAARLAATATGGSDGAQIPAGTFWTVNGLIYTQDALAVIAGGSAQINVTCLTPGAAGNSTGTLSLVSPIPTIGSTAIIAAPQIVQGVDAEDLEVYRARVIQRMQNKPQGGAVADYVAWALEVAGIVKAFAVRTSPGYVTVYPLQATTGASRVPVAGKITEVASHLADTVRRPLCANVSAAAMTERTVDFTITGLSPTDATTKANIVAALTAFLYAAYPRQYPDEAAPTDWLSVAAAWGIVAAQGAIASAVAMTVSGIGTVSSYQLPAGEIAKIGTVTWA